MRNVFSKEQINGIYTANSMLTILNNQNKNETRM